MQGNPANPSQQHYDGHLASYYSWSVGGAEAAIARAAAELAALGVKPAKGSQVVDLGAGFGAHALALARAGAQVTAVDASRELLAELCALAGDLSVAIEAGEIVEFIERPGDEAHFVLCMGDTLTHLASVEHARRLVRASIARVAMGGKLVLTFRDYTKAALDSEFHVVVRSEPERIATCIVEHRAAGVYVRDLLHERIDERWRVQTSRYVKLRLAPAEVAAWLEAAGAHVELGSTPSGMAAIVATRREL